jgi:hypothetical protein
LIIGGNVNWFEPDALGTVHGLVDGQIDWELDIAGDVGCPLMLLART